MIVCKALKDEGIDAVLTGGAVVSIYTENRYMSYDLDFISHASGKRIAAAMEGIGFRKRSGRYFEHPHTDFFVEFPTPPVAIGNKPVDRFEEIESPGGYLKLLTPTHSVMDRLAAWYHWNDPQSLDRTGPPRRKGSQDRHERDKGMVRCGGDGREVFALRGEVEGAEE